MSDLHGAIMNLPAKSTAGSYAVGHRDARHAAAELAAQHEAALRAKADKLAEALQSIINASNDAAGWAFRESLHEQGRRFGLDQSADIARAALAEYRGEEK